MNAAHVVVGSLALLANLAAGVLGVHLYRRVGTSTRFWQLLRAGQGLAVLSAALGGLTLLIDHHSTGLHALYGVLPLVVNLLAEQFRAASAAMVLAGRGLEGSRAVATLPEEEQQVVAMTILQREQGVMALAALVTVGLLIRAATTA